jgi:hypothetical protein
MMKTITRSDRWIHGENAEALFDEMLDECYPAIKIGTLEYSPSHVLKKVDPIAYRIGLSEYEDSCCEEEE